MIGLFCRISSLAQGSFAKRSIIIRSLLLVATSYIHMFILHQFTNLYVCKYTCVYQKFYMYIASCMQPSRTNSRPYMYVSIHVYIKNLHVHILGMSYVSYVAITSIHNLTPFWHTLSLTHTKHTLSFTHTHTNSMGAIFEINIRIESTTHTHAHEAHTHSLSHTHTTHTLLYIYTSRRCITSLFFSSHIFHAKTITTS